MLQQGSMSATTNTPETKTPQPFRKFTLLPDGVIALQTQESNPLPGPGVARLKAGPHWSRPDFDLLPDSIHAAGQQPADMQSAIQAWLPIYVSETLPFLKSDENAPEIVRPILDAVAEQGGMAERAKLSMPELDAASRFYLRQKGLRLGPVHVYYHALLKPAPLTLRALLWATHQGISHPLPYPRPGVTSYGWPEDVQPDAELQHWFGYPLYARRGCRVDRVDKIVCDAYDTAVKGVFQVKNAWAEWLGCKVEDVCQLLTELGHARTTPAVETPVEGAEADKSPIMFRLKSDRPQREPQERKERPQRREAREPRQEGGKVKPFKKGGKKPEGKKPFEKKDKEAPLMASPFAGLKDMMGG